MGKYNLQKHTRNLFPWFWQNDTNLAFLDVIIEGVFSSSNNKLAALEIETADKVGYSIQRLSLENSLNNKFDESLSRITVSNGTVTGSGYVYNLSETIAPDQEIYLYNSDEKLTALQVEEYAFNTGEIGGGSATGFIVTVPIDSQGKEQEIRAWIEYVQIFGTDYTLIFM